MELSLATRSVSDHVVLEIGGEIDVYTAPKLRERLLEMVNSGEKRSGILMPACSATSARNVVPVGAAPIGMA